MHTHTFTHTRVLRAAPCLLIQLMTVLKHMLTIIAPKMFQNKSNLLGILVSSHVTKRVSSCFREHPGNHSSERIPHPPGAGEPHYLFKHGLCSVNMQPETGWTQRSLFQQKPGKSKSPPLPLWLLREENLSLFAQPAPLQLLPRPPERS